jgi:hypothetical protein
MKCSVEHFASVMPISVAIFYTFPNVFSLRFERNLIPDLAPEVVIPTKLLNAKSIRIHMVMIPHFNYRSALVEILISLEFS